MIVSFQCVKPHHFNDSVCSVTPPLPVPVRVGHADLLHQRISLSASSHFTIKLQYTHKPSTERHCKSYLFTWSRCYLESCVAMGRKQGCCLTFLLFPCIVIHIVLLKRIVKTYC